GLAVVHGTHDPESDRNGLGVETPDDSLEIGPTPDRIDLVERCSDRGEPQTLDARFVHAGRIVIAEESLDASPGPVLALRNLLEQVFDLASVRLAGSGPATPACQLGRNRVRSPPRPVRVRVEVGAWIDLPIDARDARGRCGGGSLARQQRDRR